MMTLRELHLRCLSLLLVLSYTGVTKISGNTFVPMTTCSCAGQSVIFICTTNGRGFTVWSGSAFMCTAGEITLTHNDRFTQTTSSCTNGITAQGIAVNGSAYTSQLNVTLSAGLVGMTVGCSLDSTDLNDVVHIGNYTLLDQSSLGPFPPPSRIVLNNTRPNMISFTWSNVRGHEGCSSLRYVVNSSNCGICSPMETTSNVFTCTDFRNLLLDSNNTCNITIQSVICDNIVGRVSFNVIKLKGPDPPLLQIIPYYSYDTSSLIKLKTNFRIVGTFNISDDPAIDGSAISYTITYSESVTGVICHSTTILASSCFNEICSHTFMGSMSDCPSSANISVTAFATNVLGNGSSSPTVERGGLNRYVDVTYISTTKRVQCTFMTTDNYSRECNATVAYGANCDQTVRIYPSGVSSNTTVSTPQVQLVDGISQYCLNVTARSGNVTAIVQGSISTSADSNLTVAITASVVTIILVIIVTVIIIAVLYWYYRQVHHPLMQVGYSMLKA